MRAGLRERAGFMEEPERGPAKMISRATVAPIARAASCPWALESVATATITSMSRKVSINFQTQGLGRAHGGKICALMGYATQQGKKDGAGKDAAGHLGGHVAGNGTPGQMSAEGKAEGYGRVYVGAGDVAQGEDDNGDGEACGEAYAQMGNLSAGNLVGHDDAGGHEDQQEGPDELGS